MKTFYMEKLGMTLEHEGKSKAGYNVVTLRAGESLIDLFEASPTNPAPTANLSEEHICLSATGSSIYDVIAIFKRKGMDPSQAEVNSGIQRQRALHLGARSGRTQDRNQDGLIDTNAKSCIIGTLVFALQVVHGSVPIGREKSL